MTPQANFMVLAPIAPARELELRALLDSMNEAPGVADPNNALIPFEQFDRLHYARLVILNDQTTGDVRVYGLEPRTYPLYLAFLGDIDGDAESFLEQLAHRAPVGLRAIFSCCADFGRETELGPWMREHETPPIANYVNWHGRTVRRAWQEAKLHDALQTFLEIHGAEFAELPAREVHRRLRDFVETEKSAGRLALTPEAPTPGEWLIKNSLHLVGMPLLFLLALPLLIFLAPFYLISLRRLEKTDPELCGRVDQAYSDGLAQAEDRLVSNQFTAMGSLKPGFVRLATTIGILGTVNWGARHLFARGRLARIRTIHFARWVFLDNRKRMVFFSNYDGTVESYMDDFINKTGFGLNMVFSNGIGYPKTNWLALDGCQDERKYKDFLRRHTLPSQVWYKAYPGLTAIDLERNSRIRAGLETRRLNEEEAREWVALL
jgi:hypothetical protein